LALKIDCIVRATFSKGANKLAETIKIALTVREASERYNIPEATLNTWRCRGGGPKFVKCGRSVRYRIDDFDAWQKERTRTSTTQMAAAE
jgi:hypothetical protein